MQADLSLPVVIQQPDVAASLVLLFHGVGASALQMQPLGQLIAARCPQAFVVSVPGAQPSDVGQGRQWFSVRGVTEENRAGRVEGAMSGFVVKVHEWQRRSGVMPAATVLVGFSQGAIMALEATLILPVVAGHVVAIAGRFAQLPQMVSNDARIDLLHGMRDQVIDPQLSVTAAECLRAASNVHLTLLPLSAHDIDRHVAAAVLDVLDQRSSSHTPAPKGMLT